MELGSGFQAKLEPFLLMSKSAKGAAAAKLIQDATSAPGVFVFGELLEVPNIQELASNEQHSKYYSLLQLFAYKTYGDYIQHKDVLPPLNPAQTTKLKHLTLVSLSMETRILPYSKLLEQLEMPTIRDLEDLIIDAIYQEVIRGKLDQKEQQFDVEYTMGRDVEPGKVKELLASLQNWATTTSSVLTTLDDKLVQLARQTDVEKKAKDANDKLYQDNLREVQDKQREARAPVQRPAPGGGPTLKSGPTAAGLLEAQRELQREKEQKEREARERGEAMDVDDPQDGGKGKNRKLPLSDTLAKVARKRNRF